MQEDRQTTEVRETSERVGNTAVDRQVVAQRTEVSGAVVAQRVVYYIGGVIIAVLALRLLFQLLGANQGSDFVGFIYNVSAPFVAPFYGMFGEPTFGSAHFDTSALVAIIIYALITVGIAKLIALTRPRDEV